MVHSMEHGHLRTLGEVPGVRAGRGLGGGAWCFTADGTRVVHVGADGRRPRNRGSVDRYSHGPTMRGQEAKLKQHQLLTAPL